MLELERLATPWTQTNRGLPLEQRVPNSSLSRSRSSKLSLRKHHPLIASARVELQFHISSYCLLAKARWQCWLEAIWVSFSHGRWSMIEVAADSTTIAVSTYFQSQETSPVPITDPRAVVYPGAGLDTLVVQVTCIVPCTLPMGPWERRMGKKNRTQARNRNRNARTDGEIKWVSCLVP